MEELLNNYIKIFMKLINKKNIKYWVYPLLLIAIFFILSTFGINSSSVGVYGSRLFSEIEDNNLIFGSPRAIRSDQYLVEIPTLVSQDINNEPLINKDIANGTNLGTNSQPTKSFFTIFRPSVWIFFLSNNTEFTFSFYWWSKFVLLLISTYVLLLEITNKNLLISIGGSLLFFFTPFIQWWIPVDSITTISFGVFCFIRLIKEKSFKKEILYGIGLTYWIISFALVLYPAFQIPMMYGAIFIALGAILKNRKRIFSNIKNVKRIIFILLMVVILTIISLLFFFKQFDSVISLMTNTVYPGSRFMSAGQGSFYHLMNGFYNILMQRDSNGSPFYNQSEASNFFMLYIPLVIWVAYKNILAFFNKKNIDWIGISISLSLLFLTIWYLLPLPDVISKYTGMYMVLPQRIFIGIGFLNYILIFYMLSKKMYVIKKEKVLDWIIAICLLVSTCYLMYLEGKYLYNSKPSSFFWPDIVSPDIKILLVVLLVPTLLGLFFLGCKKLFLFSFISFGLISTIYINPLYKGLDILINTDLADYITEVSTKDDSRWIIYGDYYLTQYALANNASVLNGVHIYPQLGIWEVLDPQEKYIDIYNRYAHIMVSEYTEGEELVKLLAMDAVELNINTCDERLKLLNVKYVLSTEPFEDDCLTHLKSFHNDQIHIYLIN